MGVEFAPVDAGTPNGRWETYPDYKDSGVEWMGEIPVDWDKIRLKMLVNLINQKAGSEDLRYIGLENIESLTGNIIETDVSPEGIANLFGSNDVLFGKLRPYLSKVLMPDFEGRCTSELLVLRPKIITRHFLFYCCLSNQFIKIVNSSTYGAKMPRASWDFIGNMVISCPPDDEQRAIAAFLDRKTAHIDILISKKERLIILLQEKRAALISYAVTKGLDPNVPMKYSGVEWLGEIPAHWQVQKLKHICSLLRDGTHQPPSRTETGIPLLSVRNIVDGQFINLPDDSLISEKDFKILQHSFEVKINDVLLAIVGATIGKIAVVKEMPSFAIQRSLAVFRPIQNITNYRYLSFFFQSLKFQQLLWSNVSFSAQPGIYLGMLANFYSTIPDRIEQHAIVAFLECETAKLDDLTAKIQEAIKTLQEYRTALISAAVTGKIDVRNENRN
ncbi:MAG: restriction endonuclease subunit S [Deltaproteobacteria bacterium]|nr:restriction endonuclease subunit S [Deltaproteobacteria bacterium]